MRRSFRSSEKRLWAGRVGCALIGLAWATSAAAQDAPLTTAQLRARVAALTETNAMLRRDIAMLSACSPPAPPPAVPVVDREAAREAARQQAELDAFNRDLQVRERVTIEREGWVITNVDYERIEANDSWIRFSWKATIHNSLDHDKVFDLDMQFLNAHGLIVDTQHQYRQGVPAFGERTFSGTTLVRMPAALSVTRVNLHAVADR